MTTRHDPVKMSWNTWVFLFLLGATMHLRGADGQWWVNDRSRNPKRGGWVESTAYVAESAYIAPEAKVLGSASVRGGARIYGKAVVAGEATVDGRVAETGYSDSVASVYGNARVMAVPSLRSGLSYMAMPSSPIMHELKIVPAFFRMP